MSKTALNNKMNFWGNASNQLDWMVHNWKCEYICMYEDCRVLRTDTWYQTLVFAFFLFW